jgi:hypothetical protein
MLVYGKKVLRYRKVGKIVEVSQGMADKRFLHK